MNDPLVPTSSSALVVPIPRRTAIAARLATATDLPFLDQLQKQHAKALGFFPRAQMEGYVENQWVLVAEDAATKQPLGYCASRDRYLKRDELGVIYQLCVTPGHQRGLIGAMLVREVFDRSAYGCKLYCCWCAQDLDANYFWESLGFIPIAFRGGSGKKKRVHIFWQRRIREGDATTPWWFPAKTDQGAIREDRLVFPIPPGTHWSEVQAVAMPASPDRALKGPKVKGPKISKPATPKGPLTTAGFGLRFGPAPASPQEPKAKRERPPREKVKADPQLVAKARELRDRYLEQVNDRMLLAPRGKYDVSRALASTAGEEKALPLLKAG